MSEPVIGVIGGSGIYDLPGLGATDELVVDTPFGLPSGPLVSGRIGGARLVFIARHGQGHRILPHEINYRANVYALKQVGVDWLISLSAVGSMREDIRPGDLVIVDQFIDRTVGRASTFFGDGIAAHVGFGDPISPVLSGVLYQTAVEVLAGGSARVHRGGTYLVMNGPQFSTRAESELHRSWGISVIGMTNMPEAKLAREAEISYATIALATDYDCWHASEEDVTVEQVIAVIRQNAANACKVIAAAVPRIPAVHDCIAASALRGAIMTAPEMIPADTRARLAPIIGKYLP